MDQLLIKKLRALFLKYKDQILIGMALIFGLIILLIFHEPQEKNQEAAPPTGAIDTLIPAGHNLIPIEIENLEQVNGLIDRFAVVNIYQVSHDQQTKSKLVGKNMKLIRAPLNPQVFAVLIKDEEQERMMSFPGPFRIVIQNRNNAETQMSKERRFSSVQIEYSKNK